MAATGLTPAEHAMLGLVSLGPRHGYEIAAHFGPEGDLGMVCPLPMSLLYAQLKRLEGLGYLEGTTELQANRPPRRVYRLTPEGEAEFWRWLDQPVQRLREVRLDFLLKLFFSSRIPAHDTDDLLRRQLGVCRDYLAALEARQARTAPDSFGYLVQQSRVTAARGTIEWLSEYVGRWPNAVMSHES
jgi:PadR family transcriptional regulator AphA